MNRTARRRILALLCLPCTLAVGVGAGGCAIYTKKSVGVAVVDAETGEPVPRADVTVRYRDAGRAVANRPKDLTSRADERGRTTIDVADFESGVLWEASAFGYLDHWSVARPPARIPDEFRIGQIGSLEAEIALYRAPSPEVIIEVPDGFRGPLAIWMQPTPRETPGKRIFTYRADDDGLVKLVATALLRRDLQWTRFVARYANGTAIEREPELTRDHRDERIAMRRVVPVPNGTIWVVGTARDQAFMRALLDPWRDRDGRYTRFDFAEWPEIVSRFRATRADEDHAGAP